MINISFFCDKKGKTIVNYGNYSIIIVGGEDYEET